jgi:hypothetical protein
VNYTWRILKLGLQDELNSEGTLLENSVVNVKWRRHATDTDGTQASYVGNTNFSAADTAAADFVALNDLTNVQVVAWLEESISDAEIARINEQLNIKINRNRTRQIKPGW